MDVKRYTIPEGEYPPLEMKAMDKWGGYVAFEATDEFVLAQDFDAVLKDRDALQGKLKVAVDALVDIACGNHDNAFVRSAIEALAQIGLPEKEG